jgi:hypothetical protein
MKWDSKNLWLKAKVYIDRANELGHGEEFAIWSALSLELLARAALTNIHPVLNADPRVDGNLLYAFGFEIVSQPRSLPAHAVFLRLEKTIPGFGKVQRELCDYLSLLRNEEIHTAELPFQKLKESEWLPRFYEVCKLLCISINKSLEDFLGGKVAASASKLINTLNVEMQQNVKQRIAAHSKVFLDKDPKEQEKLRSVAESRIKLLPHGATAEPCPACQSFGVLRGELMKETKPKYEQETLSVERELIAVEFMCLACGLALHSPEEIAQTPIEPRFSQQRATDLHELFQPEEYDEYMNM